VIQKARGLSRAAAQPKHFLNRGNNEVHRWQCEQTGISYGLQFKRMHDGHVGTISVAVIRFNMKTASGVLVSCSRTTTIVRLQVQEKIFVMVVLRYSNDCGCS
jgi:hypothetical protein